MAALTAVVGSVLSFAILYASLEAIYFDRPVAVLIKVAVTFLWWLGFFCLIVPT
jgi:hypothetical protein